jgi:oligoribonuclease
MIARSPAPAIALAPHAGHARRPSAVGPCLPIVGAIVLVSLAPAWAHSGPDPVDVTPSAFPAGRTGSELASPAPAQQRSVDHCRVRTWQTPGVPYTPNEKSENLVWIDLEMTGLDPTKHVILQAALVVTTADLEPIDELAIDVAQPADALANMSPLVRTMHTRTGLLERVRRSAVGVAEAELLLLDRIVATCPAPATLCGNSVWVDRCFIAQYMPVLDAHFHYRLVDVSTLKVLAQRWYGERAVFQKSTVGEHDAAVDIKNSIAELRHYRRTLFLGTTGSLTR